MDQERGRNAENISRGQIYSLSHPDSDLFSGYGLTTEEGRNDRLTGILMVDRPQPADPGWLAELEVRYGDYQLVPMTATGERGLVTQMRIAPESVPHLARFSNLLGQELTRVLKPLLAAPPAPVLKLRWDEEHKLWQSEFWLGLPPELQAVFERQGYGCLAVERADHTVAFVTHVADAELPRFHQAPVLWRWETIRMPTAPLIRFSAAILDNPVKPYRLEHFLNVDDPEQARCLGRLVQQAELSFDFYGEEYEYAYSKKIAHREEMRRRLTEIVRQAIEVYGTIPATQRNFDAAKAAFQRTFPI